MFTLENNLTYVAELCNTCHSNIILWEYLLDILFKKFICLEYCADIYFMSFGS